MIRPGPSARPRSGSPQQKFSRSWLEPGILRGPRPLPRDAAVRRPLGPLPAQPEVPAAARVPVASLLSAARAADRAVTETGCVPAQVSIGGANVGPNAFLQAARAFMEELNGTDKPKEVAMHAGGEHVRLAARGFCPPQVPRQLVIFPRDFEAPHVAEMARWQAWTGKPARPVRPSDGGE